jgi:hypothetical protein
MNQYSSRADEVARDLLSSLDAELQASGPASPSLRFHLEGSGKTLSRAEAEEWIKQSVDEGFPEVRYYIERSDSSETVINLAAFEDPDSQYYV